MKRMTIAALALLGLAVVGWSFACCNLPFHQGDGQSWISCQHQVQLNENVELTIPKRLALHLTETEWNLDLNDPPAGDVQAGEGCFLVPKTFSGTPQDLLAMLENGELTPADTYPAIVDIDGDGQISNSEKGTLVCFNKKVLQKFCNNWQTGTNYGCEFDLKVNMVMPAGVTGGYGRLFFYDEATLPPVGQVAYNPFIEITPGQNDEGSPIEVLKVRGARFPGWLDDFITEGFWFDGSELPGTYQFNVVFMLSAI